MKTYEAMFLVDAGNPDFEAAGAPVREVLTRAKAEVLVFKAWDERRLAYEIKGRNRGLYILTYFKADPAAMEALHHDIQLSERIIRAMIFTAEDVTPEQMNADTPATARTKPVEAAPAVVPDAPVAVVPDAPVAVVPVDAIEGPLDESGPAEVK